MQQKGKLLLYTGALSLSPSHTRLRATPSICKRDPNNSEVAFSGRSLRELRRLERLVTVRHKSDRHTDTYTDKLMGGEISTVTSKKSELDKQIWQYVCKI